MIIGKKCPSCKGKGFWIGGGFIRKNCVTCRGTGLDNTEEEHLMHKMLNVSSVAKNFKLSDAEKAAKAANDAKESSDKKIESMADQSLDDMKKSISEMTTEELRAALPTKKRGRPKNDKEE